MTNADVRRGSVEEYQRSKGIWFDDDDRVRAEQQAQAHRQPEYGEIPDVDPALAVARKISAAAGRVPSDTELAHRLKIGLLRAHRIAQALRDEIANRRG